AGRVAGAGAGRCGHAAAGDAPGGAFLEAGRVSRELTRESTRLAGGGRLGLERGRQPGARRSKAGRTRASGGGAGGARRGHDGGDEKRSQAEEPGGRPELLAATATAGESHAIGLGAVRNAPGSRARVVHGASWLASVDGPQKADDMPLGTRNAPRRPVCDDSVICRHSVVWTGPTRPR